jgi:hypothetical protein
MKDTSNVKPRNIGKVAEILAEDPNTTHRGLQEATWLASNTIQKAKDELKQTWSKDPIISYIVEGAKNRLQRIDGLLDRFVLEAEEKPTLDRRDISLVKDFAKDDLQRITVLGWDVTDDGGWLKDMKAMTTEQLLEFIEAKWQQ